MKQEFEVGDWVKMPNWDNFYEVLCVDGLVLYLKDNESGYIGSYSSLLYEFIKKEQTMKIDPNKKYRRVGTHEPVRIICTDRVTQGDTFPCVGLRKGGGGIESMEYFDHEGRDQCGNLSIEEVPQTDWNKVKVDTLIWVSNCPRYFAGYEDGDVLFYSMGTTSLTYKAMNAEILTASRNVTVSLEKPNA